VVVAPDSSSAYTFIYGTILTGTDDKAQGLSLSKYYPLDRICDDSSWWAPLLGHHGGGCTSEYNGSMTTTRERLLLLLCLLERLCLQMMLKK